jgi:hypothetical protein
MYAKVEEDSGNIIAFQTYFEDEAALLFLTKLFEGCKDCINFRN